MAYLRVENERMYVLEAAGERLVLIIFCFQKKNGKPILFWIQANLLSLAMGTEQNNLFLTTSMTDKNLFLVQWHGIC